MNMGVTFSELNAMDILEFLGLWKLFKKSKK